MSTIYKNSKVQASIDDLLNRTVNLYSKNETDRLNDFIMQIKNGKEFTSENKNQKPHFYYPYINTMPWYDPEKYEGTRILEKSFPVIREEMLNVLHKKTGFIPYVTDTARKEDGIKGEMNLFHLRDAFTINQDKLKNNRNLCPRTAKIVDELPRTGEISLFSALNPGTHLTPHCGAENLRQTVHLALKIPEKCQITVSGITKGWTEGQCIMFDDSFLHEASNDSNKTRFILLLDVWHPELTEAEIFFFRSIGPMLTYNPDLINDLRHIEDNLENQVWWVD